MDTSMPGDNKRSRDEAAAAEAAAATSEARVMLWAPAGDPIHNIFKAMPQESKDEVMMAANPVAQRAMIMEWYEAVRRDQQRRTEAMMQQQEEQERLESELKGLTEFDPNHSN